MHEKGKESNMHQQLMLRINIHYERRQRNLSMMRLQMDFSDFYKEARIKKELIVPYKPQQISSLIKR